MPNRDQTGPEGKGPNTGRNQGECESSTTEYTCRRDGFGRNRRNNSGRRGKGRRCN